VETIAGTGYRFIAPLEPTDAPVLVAEPAHEVVPPVDVATASVERAVARTTEDAAVRALWTRTAGAFLALLLVAGVGGWFAWRHFNAQQHTIRSIAVIPLQNLSGDSSQDYFADGLTEELITELSRIESLRVISHTSVMDYKGTKKHLPEVARELGVDAILEGSVIRENNNVRVTVQLLDGPADRHLWGEEYERRKTQRNAAGSASLSTCG
jgi:TolB-like protein